MQLPIAEFRAEYQAQAAFVRPFHEGGLIHGLLGRALHGGPLFERFFAPRAPVGHPLLREGAGAPSALLPVLPPPRRVSCQRGDRVPMTLRVFGPLALDERAALTEALVQLGKSPWGEGEVRCTGVQSRDLPELVLAPPVPALAVRGEQRLTLRFLTPTCLKQDGRLVTQVQVRLLVLAAYRRLSALCALYGTLAPEHREALAWHLQQADEVQVQSQELRPLRWRRESWERGDGHPLAGLLGTVVLRGSLAPLMPLLRAAALCHLGKGTSFGQGRLAVERLEGGSL